MTTQNAQNAGFTEGLLPVAPGMTLYYRDYGPADSDLAPVVCLHGYWRTSRDFHEMAEHLASTRRVVIVDQRGRGQSSRSTDVADYAYEKLIEDVIQLKETLGIGEAVIAGAALGAQIGMWLAANKPEHVAGLIFNDSGPESSSSTNKTMASFAGDDEISFEDAVERVRLQYEPQCPRFGRDDWVRMMLRSYRKAPSGKYVRDFDQLTNKDIPRFYKTFPTFWKEYDAIKAPMVLLRGENSQYLTPEIAADMAARNDNLRVHVIPGVGHPVFLYEAEAFAAIDELLVRVDGR